VNATTASISASDSDPPKAGMPPRPSRTIRAWSPASGKLSTTAAAVSATQGGLRNLSQAAIILGHLVDYLDYDFQEDDAYAAQFMHTIAAHDIIISRHHGYYVLGRCASEAFFRAYYLRQACSVQMKAAATAAGTGDRVAPIDPQRVAMIQDQMAASENYHYDGSTEWAALLRKLDRSCPDYAT